MDHVGASGPAMAEREDDDSAVITSVVRGLDGRFLKGHPCLGSRPPGAANKLGRSLRERVLLGIGDVEKFVEHLCLTQPGAAAGLLAKLLPPEPEPESGTGGTGGTVIVNVLPIARG